MFDYKSDAKINFVHLSTYLSLPMTAKKKLKVQFVKSYWEVFETMFGEGAQDLSVPASDITHSEKLAG